MRAFEGIRVFDATQGVAGPHCAMLLAQHGADVVKLEPMAGDWGRAIGKKHGEHSAYGLAVNRGKRSIAVDLKNPEGVAIAKRLAAGADVVLESFRPGVMGRFGLDYASVKTGNPSVIYLSVTGYGQEGPYSKRPVTDSVIQAYSGWMSINKDKDGLPQRISIIAVDVMTGLYAFQAVAPAL
ncbi:MAG TPA: CoA transferase, partial [Alphaproteobacteria bacterium]|nr:CoA transferase [Alphaproteobacteria bacterium]